MGEHMEAAEAARALRLVGESALGAARGIQGANEAMADALSAVDLLIADLDRLIEEAGA